jgi:hypothetical protein
MLQCFQLTFSDGGSDLQTGFALLLVKKSRMPPYAHFTPSGIMY